MNCTDAIEHLEACPGCDECDRLMEFFQVCERCQRFAHACTLTASESGEMVCDGCLIDE